MTSRSLLVAALCCIMAPRAGVRAQRPPGADTLSKRATADSLNVLKQLDLRTRAAPQDAAAWYRRGMVASLLATRARERHLPAGLTHKELDATAAKSLKTAVALDSTNARYWHSVSQYYRTGTYEESRQYTDIVERVIRLSRVAHDTSLLVDALVGLASTRFNDWYQYDQTVDQAPSRLPPRVAEPPPIADGVRMAYSRDAQLTPLTQQSGPSSWDRPLGGVAQAAGKDSVKFIADVLRVAIDRVERTVGLVVRSGPSDAQRRRIETMFEEAFAAAPRDARVFPHLATLYTAGGEWERLAVIARQQTRRTPREAQAWMALGLARHRLSATADAAAAFATALAWMPPRDRARVDRLDRIMTWYDSSQFAQRSAAERDGIATRTWMFADPLWSVDDGNPRQEFLARLAYAELRWPQPVSRPDDDTTTVSGADTRRGDLYVRYGPPNAVRGGFWLYDAGLIFTAGIGARARRVQEGVEFYQTTERTEDWQPARWDNVTTLRVDSMPFQLARFREGRDSVSVFIAAHTTLGAMRDSSGRAAMPSARVWFVNEESLRPLEASALLDTLGLLQWTQHVPHGTYYYRAETTAPRLGIAGRASGSVRAATDTTTGFATSGFGISDPLLATNVQVPAALQRWNDIGITPLLGHVTLGSAVSIVWENYELGEKDGTASYEVKLILERKWQMFLNRVRARVTSAWAAMLGSEQTTDRLIFRYDRAATHATALADVVTLALEDTPAGNYDLTLEITDKVTGKVAARTVRLVVHE